MLFFNIKAFKRKSITSWLFMNFPQFLGNKFRLPCNSMLILLTKKTNLAQNLIFSSLFAFDVVWFLIGYHLISSAGVRVLHKNDIEWGWNWEEKISSHTVSLFYLTYIKLVVSSQCWNVLRKLKKSNWLRISNLKCDSMLL